MVKARDREGLERLARYLLRPLLAKSRLALRDDGDDRGHYQRARSDATRSDGTRAMVFSRTGLPERLASLVPPPSRNLVIDHGVFAAGAAWRSRVEPRRPADQEAPASIDG